MSEFIFRQYFGPSPRHDRACVEMSFPSGAGDHRLRALDPVLAAHGLRLGEELPDVPVPLHEAVLRLARAMLARHAPWWGRSGSENGRDWAAIAHPLPTWGALALGVAYDLLLSKDALSPAAEQNLRKLSSWLAKAYKTRLRILASAEALGLDAAHVETGSDMCQIGQGAKGLHFVQAANEHDSLTGSLLTQDKYMTGALLRRVGLPATRAMQVSHKRQVREAIERVGLPCVVKPVALQGGAGVATLLRTEAQALAALAHVQTLSRSPALIENHVEGDDHRVFVGCGELLWAYRLMPATVVGDGRSTIAELLERENHRRAAIRGGSESYVLPIGIDDQLERLLADRYRLGLTSVLEAGRRIEVTSQANTARGGVKDDVTAIVHPDNRDLAIRVARLFRMHALGIDFITPDISRSWKEVPCAIVEANRTPGTSGIGDAMLLLRTLFPNRFSGRIPTVAVLGERDFRDRMADTVGGAFARSGTRLATVEYPGDGPPPPAVAPRATATSVETAILDTDAEALLFLCDPGEVERAGFPLRHCDLLVAETDPPAWLASAADAVAAGKASARKIAQAIGDLARRYADPAEGGPRPVLEPIEAGSSDAGFHVLVWRARAMPREWFWHELGLDAPDGAGMTTFVDLLAAAHALADRSLREAGLGRLARPFTHDEIEASWSHIAFEAAMPLPAKHREAARAALLAAVERINQIVVAKIR